MEQMLITATQGEIRVAHVKDDILINLDGEKADTAKKKANIYLGKITRIEPSLEAAFVEFGSSRQGFLPLKEVAEEHYLKSMTDFPENEKPSIKELLKEGQEFLIQVEKDERGTKGAALSSYITLAGCYLVLMPNNPGSGGISRRIEGEEREALRESLNALKVPDGMGVIIRTAGVGKTTEELQWDLDVLINQWDRIQKATKDCSPPALIHQDSDVVTRSIRDNLRKNIDEIIIDDQAIFVKAKNYIEQIKPSFLNCLKLYQDTVPLFTRFKIESQIESAYQREVRLPSGGSIVIDRTEALVSIDINSARSTRGGDIEETALHTNLEAANEIARQLRLRDLGGLIVIDFIDMTPLNHQRQTENELREALKTDRARVQVGRISRFGLLEMSRQRLHLALGESNQGLCPQCDGRGIIRSVESLAISVLRVIEEKALDEKNFGVNLQLPVELATYLMNERRASIANIEKRHQIEVTLIPNKYMHIPNYTIEPITKPIAKGETQSQKSYELVEKPELSYEQPKEVAQTSVETPAIKRTVMPGRKVAHQKPGLFIRLWRSLFGTGTPDKKPNRQRRGKSRRPSGSGSTQQHRRRHTQSRGRGPRQGQQRQQSRNRPSRQPSQKNTTSQ